MAHDLPESESQTPDGVPLGWEAPWEKPQMMAVEEREGMWTLPRECQLRLLREVTTLPSNPNTPPLYSSPPPLASLFPMYPRRRTRQPNGRTDLLKHILNRSGGLDYKCKDCGQWLSTYHNSHRNHFSACKWRLKEAKDVAKRIEKHGIRIKHGVLTLHRRLEPAGSDPQVGSVPEGGTYPFPCID